MKSSPVRDKIVETASELFYQNGYNLTGINEIIKEAGIAKATLYNHFKSKEDICIAFLQRRNGQFLLDINQYTQEKPKGIEQVLSIFDFLALFFKDKEFNGCWCINTISEIPKSDTVIRKEIQKEKEAFLLFIQKLIMANIPLEEDKVKQQAKKLYLLYEGAVSESHLHQEAWPIGEAKSIAELVLT